MRKRHLSHHGRFKHSLFTRITFAIILGGLLINIVVAIFFRHMGDHGKDSPVKQNINAYALSVIQEVGTPPDMDRARLISKERGLELVYISKNETMSTSDNVMEIINSSGTSFKRNPKFFRGSFIYQLKQHEATWYFIIKPSRHVPGNLTEALPAVVVILSIIILALIIMIRWILRPIRELEKGVRAVSSGDFSYQVPVKGKDELASLSRAYNEMREKIQSMLKLKEQLLVDISHELRSPLTRLKVALEMMETGKFQDEMKEDAEEMSTMINSLLDNYRLGNSLAEIDSTPVNMGELVGKTISRGSSDRTVLKPSPHDCIVPGDEKLLQRMVHNIFSNAEKYSPTGNIMVNLERENEQCVLTVTDQGPGIDPDHIGHVFEPFYRADPSRNRETGGFGLGLSICKRIVEAHGGTITLANMEPGGLAVTVKLPIQA